ncbi:MAG TPA: type I restriction endonuclease, partial [Thermomicrobiales bacterium]|nr:type I restriction endonuclease [Thermomicrobiales bacterium]
MTRGRFTESDVEEAALEWLGQLGWTVRYGPDIAPGGCHAERTDYHDPLLSGRLEAAIARLNPGASVEAREEALRQVTRVGAPSLVQANRAFHHLLVNGVEAEVVRDGETRGELIRLVDFDEPANNDLLAVNQYTIV